MGRIHWSLQHFTAAKDLETSRWQPWKGFLLTAVTNNQVGNLSCKDRVGLLVVFASSNATCWIFCTQIRGKKKQQFPSPFFENTRSRQQCSLNKIQGQRASPLHGERAGSSHLVNCYLRSIDRLDVGSQFFANKYFRPPNGHITSWQTKSFGIRIDKWMPSAAGFPFFNNFWHLYSLCYRYHALVQKGTLLISIFCLKSPLDHSSRGKLH